jgi:hypothetical protein
VECRQTPFQKSLDVSNLTASTSDPSDGTNPLSAQLAKTPDTLAPPKLTFAAEKGCDISATHQEFVSAARCLESHGANAPLDGYGKAGNATGRKRGPTHE